MMSNAEEAVTGLFALVISGFVALILFMSLNGYNISGVAQIFTNFIPSFVIFLILLFIGIRIFEEF